MVTKTIRDARDLYHRESLERNEGNSKGLWSSLNNILHPNQTSCVQSSFDLDGMEISDEIIIATKFNEYFSNVGKNLATCFTNEYCPTSVLDNLEPRVGSNFNFSHINVSDVETVLASIKNS